MTKTDDLAKRILVADQSENRYTIRTAADALQPQPPIEWIVQNLFSAGSISLIVGESGSKKTWAMLDAAVSIAKGDRWLDFPTTQSAVLLIDEDNGERKFAGRLNKVLRAHEANENTPINYISLAAFDFGNNADIDELHNLIIQTNARFILIDTMAGVMPGRDENAVKDVQPIFLNLRRVVERTGTAIVLIHHTNKTGSYRGSSALKGAVDLLLMVDSKPDSPHIDFKTEKARDTEPVNFSAVANFQPDWFWLSASETKGPARAFNKGQGYVMRYLLEHGASPMAEIKSNADVCSEETARRSVYSLAVDKLVTRVDAGGQGAAAIFDLTSKGRGLAEKE